MPSPDFNAKSVGQRTISVKWELVQSLQAHFRRPLTCSLLSSAGTALCPALVPMTRLSLLLRVYDASALQAWVPPMSALFGCIMPLVGTLVVHAPLATREASRRRVQQAPRPKDPRPWDGSGLQ